MKPKDYRAPPKRAKTHRQSSKNKKTNTSWDPIADWYGGWMGKKGGAFHQQIALPSVIQLLNPLQNEKILDIGCGQGVLAPSIVKAGAFYTGIDASKKLIRQARRLHSENNFFVGDARQLHKKLGNRKYDGAVFLLSIQDMEPLEDVLVSAESHLKPNGRLVIFMTHPCFRIPRQSGWGYDKQRKLHYRRIDRYLSRLAVPLKQYKTADGRRQTTRSYHRPLQDYINTLADCGLLIERLDELSSSGLRLKGKPREQENREIPHFLGLRARKAG